MTKAETMIKVHTEKGAGYIAAQMFNHKDDFQAFMEFATRALKEYAKTQLKPQEGERELQSLKDKINSLIKYEKLTPEKEAYNNGITDAILELEMQNPTPPKG